MTEPTEPVEGVEDAGAAVLARSAWWRAARCRFFSFSDGVEAGVEERREGEREQREEVGCGGHLEVQGCS